jgi:hypothetical protein
MEKHRFRPHVEALDPRVLPDATPLTADIVGPFALGMYPDAPPPGPHGPGPLARLEAQADAWLADADAAIDQASQQPPDGTNSHLRSGLEALRDWLGQQASSADAAAAQAQASADRAASRGHAQSAAVFALLANADTGLAQSYRERQSDVNGILSHADDELQTYAVSDLGYWLGLASDRRAIARDAQATIRQGGLSRADRTSWAGVEAYNAGRADADAQASLGLWQVIYVLGGQP